MNLVIVLSFDKGHHKTRSFTIRKIGQIQRGKDLNSVIPALSFKGTVHCRAMKLILESHNPGSGRIAVKGQKPGLTSST